MDLAALNAKLQQAMSMLQAGRLQEAEAMAQDVLRQAPNHPDAYHLLAMAARQRRQFSHAEQFFQKSLSLQPNQPPLLANYANMLMSLGRYDEAIQHYQKAVKLQPNFTNGWYNLGIVLNIVGRHDEAVKAGETLTGLIGHWAPAWELLGTARMKAGQQERAREAYLKGVELDPKNGHLWASYGSFLKDEAEFGAAADAFEKARALGINVPDLYQGLAEAYYEAKQVDKALQVHDEAIRQFPHDPQAHFVRAKFRWEAGHGDDHLAALEKAISEQPGNPHLWGSYFDLLSRQNRFDDILKGVSVARKSCQNIPRLQLAEAVSLSALERYDEATGVYEKLLAADPHGIPPKRAFAEHLLTSGDPVRAATLCEDMIAQDPYDQAALALQGTAWEMMGDERAAWLLDYERMVNPVDVPLPDGFSDREDYFKMVQAELDVMHQMQAHPLDQTLRGGTQTNGFIFRLKNPVLQQLRQQIEIAIQSVLDRFPNDPDHPFWGRKTNGFDFKGAWSVKLRSQGFHTNHYHPEGWFSSALYIALPDVVHEETNTREGHIQFGVPTAEMKIDLPAKRIVKPEVGRLVLFPSYMWHGTIPFNSDQPRMTIAFDFVPKG